MNGGISDFRFIFFGMRIARTAFTLALALLIGTCAACGTSPPPSAAYAAPQRAEQLESKTVAIIDPLVERPYCTGVWVSGSAWLTANHCMGALTSGDTVTYVTRSDVVGDAVVGTKVGVLVAQDELHDLALVVDPNPPAHASAGVAGVVVGQTSETMGHPLGLWWSYSQGHIAAIRKKSFGGKEELLWVQSTAPISRGNSGGGLFDENGDLIGLCDATIRGGENLNLFVHPSYIKAFLEAAAAAAGAK